MLREQLLLVLLLLQQPASLWPVDGTASGLTSASSRVSTGVLPAACQRPCALPVRNLSAWLLPPSAPLSTACSAARHRNSHTSGCAAATPELGIFSRLRGSDAHRPALRPRGPPLMRRLLQQRPKRDPPPFAARLLPRRASSRARDPPAGRRFSASAEGAHEAEQVLLGGKPYLLPPPQASARMGVMSFALGSTLQTLGFQTPIGPQQETFALAATGSDLALHAPTGSGKTLSLLLPLLQWHAARLAAAAPAAAAAAANACSNGSSPWARSSSSSKGPITDLPHAASALSPAAASAVATADAVSLLVAPSSLLALQLMRELRSASAAWVEAAAKAQAAGYGPLMPEGPLPRLLLLCGETAEEETQGPPNDFASLGDPRCRTDASGLILVTIPGALKRFAVRLATEAPGALRHLAASVRHLALDEVDRLLQPLRRHAPLKLRMQSLERPQPLEVLMRLLVVSRSSKKRSGDSFSSLQGWGQQAGQQLPLQLLAASATLGRPLHRRLAAFVRWKEQQLPQARDPPLHSGILGCSRSAAAAARQRRQALAAFITPQQQMREAFERLAARGLLGLPRLLPSQGDRQPPSPPTAFKALLPTIRPPITDSPPSVAMAEASGPAAREVSSAGPSYGVADPQDGPGDGTEGGALPGGPSAATRRLVGIPSCISHKLFPVSDDSLESLAEAAAEICNALKPRRALLLLQQGSSLRTLQLYMRKRNLKVDLLHEAAWWRPRAAQRVARSPPRVEEKEKEREREKEKKGQLLAATMDAARGLHVEGAEVVLLLGRVKTAREYQHLAGRVGRCGVQGLCVSVSGTANQRVVASWARTLGISFEPLSPLVSMQTPNAADGKPPPGPLAKAQSKDEQLQQLFTDGQTKREGRGQQIAGQIQQGPDGLSHSSSKASSNKVSSSKASSNEASSNEASSNKASSNKASSNKATRLPAPQELARPWGDQVFQPKAEGQPEESVAIDLKSLELPSLLLMRQQQ